MAPTSTAVKLGAILFLVWGILHIWVLYDGVEHYVSREGVKGQWNALIGGAKVPRNSFQHADNESTKFAHSQLILNFCLDVGGYGFLGVAVAGMLWFNQSAWIAYAIGTFVIGVADLAFLFGLVTSGVIEFSFPVILGPVLWFIAVIVTPFGLPWGSAAANSAHVHKSK